MLGLLEGNEDQTAPAGGMLALLVCKWIAAFQWMPLGFCNTRAAVRWS